MVVRASLLHAATVVLRATSLGNRGGAGFQPARHQLRRLPPLLTASP
ncbi:MAG: hypothetical protein M5U12_18730 [Verrucomicrobia bacterium]|nr:hypothetical protein [Verrucomicrobiota bacterium]